jgi:NADPH:quinone reductase-like Zn-dependent oxidoreductase
MVQMAKLCGGWVIGVDVADAKLEMARSLGADAVIDGRRDTLVREVMTLTEGRGVDAAIDTVGSTGTLEGSVASLARAGRLVIIGHRPREVFGVEATFRVDPALVLNRMLEIHGSRYVTLAEIGQTLELLRQRRIKAVVTRTFPLEDVEEAHELLRTNALVGRAALLVQGP